MLPLSILGDGLLLSKIFSTFSQSYSYVFLIPQFCFNTESCYAKLCCSDWNGSLVFGLY